MRKEDEGRRENFSAVLRIKNKEYQLNFTRRDEGNGESFSAVLTTHTER
jgi:hypothetical protein